MEMGRKDLVWSSAESMTKPREWFDFRSSIALNLLEAIGFHADFYGDNV
jgi:hypothetical protein